MLFVLGLALLLGLGLSLASSGTVVWAAELGDAAPPLQVAKWIKGEAVDIAKGKDKNVFVVEFWATWCPPCRTSIPHISKLAKKFRDRGVVVVGVTNETDADKVATFVKGQGDDMDYVVAQDDGQKTSEGYMKAFGQGGIPHAFVVDRTGKIVWHGHPMGGLDLAVEAVVEGKFDLAKARADDKLAQEARAQATQMREYFSGLARAQQAGEKFLEANKSNPMALNEFAWTILTSKAVRARDFDLALRAAKAAVEASEAKDAAILDTLARALHDTGDRTQAIEVQRKAVERATDDAMRNELKATLETYEKEASVRI
jgi:thiol-disulfide isomerase/thioredoxin